MKKTIKIGLIGYGVVGQGVIKILENNKKSIEKKIGASIEIAGICDHKRNTGQYTYIKDYKELIDNKEIDIIVELIGGYDPAKTIILTALQKGKHVVTANKAVLSKYWDQIFTTAKNNYKLVYFEASVAGAIPVIQSLNEGLSANKIEKIQGILNGTTNFILSEMTKEKTNFETALQTAQKSGFAEANSSFDIEGIDTANKLAILSSLAWSNWIKVDDIYIKGIQEISEDDIYFAGNFGYVIKLIGSAEMTKQGLSLSVQPCLVPSDHTFANVEKEYNAVRIHGDAVGDTMFYGKGAGQMPAASAVVSDIIFLSKQVANSTAGKGSRITYDPSKKIKIIPAEKQQSSFYLRFTTIDQPGVLSKISGILGRFKVSIASVYQQEHVSKLRKGVPILMLTHLTTMGNLNKAIKAIDNLPIVKEKTISFKVEKDEA